MQEKYKINFSNEWFVVTEKCPNRVVIIHEMGRDIPTEYKTAEKGMEAEIHPYAKTEWKKLDEENQGKYGYYFPEFVKYYTSGHYVNPVTGENGMAIKIKSYSRESIIKLAQRNAAWPFKLGYVESVKGDD